MINKVTLLGRLGKDPEIRYTNSGQAVCNLSLATTDHWKDAKGVKQERTEWHRVIIWGKLGETANTYLKKGNIVHLDGKLQTRSWEDKTGAKRWATEILATSMQLLPQGNGERTEDPPTPDDPPPSFNPKPQDQPFNFDDIPF